MDIFINNVRINYIKQCKDNNCKILSFTGHINFSGGLHRSKRSSAWGPPDSRGPPNLYLKKGCGITITRNAFNQIIVLATIEI